jgi:hypothetical protein
MNGFGEMAETAGKLHRLFAIASGQVGWPTSAVETTNSVISPAGYLVTLAGVFGGQRKSAHAAYHYVCNMNPGKC